jgi:bis(5'-adenosyl)-triphosphatase
VLVVPIRRVRRLSDLRDDEISDLFLSVNKVGKVIEKAYAGEGLTISCQVQSCGAHA